MPENVAPKLAESHLVEGEMPVRSAPPAAAKQHYAIDIAGGVAVTAACFGLGLLPGWPDIEEDSTPFGRNRRAGKAPPERG